MLLADRRYAVNIHRGMLLRERRYAVSIHRSMLLRDKRYAVSRHRGMLLENRRYTRLSLEMRDLLMKQETGDFLIGGAQNGKDMRFSLET